MTAKPAKKKYEIDLPSYVRKYDFVKRDPNLTRREQDTLCEAFRYWPEVKKVSLPPQSTMTNETLTKNLGYKDMCTVERILKSLVKKGYIFRETVTKIIDDKPKSRRVMLWLKFPTPAKQRVSTSPNSGLAPRQMAEKHPPNGGPTIIDYNNNKNASSLKLANGFAKPQKKTLKD